MIPNNIKLPFWLFKEKTTLVYKPFRDFDENVEPVMAPRKDETVSLSCNLANGSANHLIDDVACPVDIRLKEIQETSCKESANKKDEILKQDIYGSESISNKTKCPHISGERTRIDADLEFKYKLGSHEYSDTLKRSCVNLRLLIVLGMLFLCFSPSLAVPMIRSESKTDNKAARSYLETFGYLSKKQPEVENLVHEDAMMSYEDDFRIAIKTLQEFGGIPVTGEIDEETKELMSRRRCGRPDRDEDYELRRKKRFVVQGPKWSHTNLTWSLSSARRPSQLNPDHTRSVLARALHVWEQASRLTFTEINSDDADIVVSFAKRYHDDSYPFDGRGSILAHAFFPGSGKGGDAHFDDDELWLLHPNNDDEEGTSLFAVAAHEFGHSLGLSHSPEKGALMYPWYQGIQPNFVLPEDDRHGIQQMYGLKEKRIWGKIPYYQPVETPRTTTSTTTTTPSTTTRRYHEHHHHHTNHHHTYTPYPRPPNKYPPNYPDRRFPERRRTTEEPKRPEYPKPRPEPTTTPSTYPRYPITNPHYPYRPYRPTDNKPPTRKPNHPDKAVTKPTPASVIPDTCDTSYDAVALIRGELFIFKNRYHWRFGANGRYSGYPREITQMWSGLPKNLTHVDAVYERPDRNIAFFVGKELYLFDTQYLIRGYPKPLTDLGLPESLEKLDAAMVWGHNGKTYFYSGTMYWNYDESAGKVELDYPRDMSMWRGVGYNIDTVFQWKDGKTYFFKGKGYWKFNDIQMRVEHERPLPSATYWMACPPERSGRKAPFKALPPPSSTLRSPSSASFVRSSIVFIASVLVVFQCF